MAAVVEIASELPCTLDEAVEQVSGTRLFLYVSYPLLTFTPVDAPAFPEQWTEGTHWVRLRLFGWLPFGKQAIVISRIAATDCFEFRDAGYSPLIKSWDHRITIEPTAEGIRYRDRVAIRAGLFTPIVWLFARFLFRHRHRRWRRLVDSGFDYSGS